MYRDWFTRHEKTRREVEQGPWRAALSKIEELPGRIGLVLALARAEAPDEIESIDADTMARAICLVDWFEAEAGRVYSILSESSEERADRELLAWVRRHPDGVTARDAARNLKRFAGKGGSKQAEGQLHRLVKAEHLLYSPSDCDSGGRPTVVYHHPPPTPTKPHLL